MLAISAMGTAFFLIGLSSERIGTWPIDSDDHRSQHVAADWPKGEISDRLRFRCAFPGQDKLALTKLP
jgi:hypothetical protein